jgi:hypothetical protein
LQEIPDKKLKTEIVGRVRPAGPIGIPKEASRLLVSKLLVSGRLDPKVYCFWSL